ncbi:unnamed protein product [Penicillium nalgiovense]|nr:unnamed protein product [Penicillium nalgiovense]
MSVHSQCQRLYTLAQGGQQIRLAEIYAGLRILGRFQNSLFLEIQVIMRR